VAGGVATVRLARSEAGNAINDEMVHGLMAAIREVEASDARAVLICGDGANFTVGGDLDHLTAQIERLSEELDEMVPVYHDALKRLAALELPVVCAAQGVVGGGGLGLLWCADVVIAASDLRLVTGFAALGLSGDGGSSWALPRMVGERRARQLLLLGRRLDAEQALTWGLVDQVVARERLQIEAEAEAARLAHGPTVAYGHIKRLLRSSSQKTFAEQLDAEHAAIVATAATADGCEGVQSFTARRRPEFGGR
jgi:2-(1,2-epoxy-1,2-dihydrophenyl)acetyl-CoA isomerase